MLSIIICSRTKTISPVLAENIKNSIGYEYELIIIDNSKNQYSIFEAYNKGIEQSNGDYLCFMHDDIMIHTEGWGKIINRIFKENREIGLIGVAGAKIKTRMPSTWSDCDDNFKVLNLIQHDKSGNVELQNMGFSDNQYEYVVAIDGVFMAARKNSLICFNEELKGFHNYDLNISFEYIINNYKIIVTKEILIEHFSIGTINKSWYNSSLKLYSLYYKHLPLIANRNSLLIDEVVKREVINGASFISQLIIKRFYFNGLKFWIKLIIRKPYTLYHLIILKSFFKNAT